MARFEAVIGLEVHAQLRTRSKIFCGCATSFGAPPNANTCPVCLGHPGALPVLNREAVRLAATAAVAFGAEVRPRSVFARKHYFYPDLPKGYQISQFDEPFATGGWVPIERDGVPRYVGLARIHLEEDAGKSIHDGMPDSDRYAYVDFNRAGVPLIEIVSRPEIRSPEEAYLYLQRLRSILRTLGVCEGNLEEGSLRCDANVSIRAAGAPGLGTRTELKNLNSFRNVQRAAAYEIARQEAVVASGGVVEQETRLWDAAAGETRPMRGKEEAHDYRYFPDPDLLPVEIDPRWLEGIRRALPELPAARKARLLGTYPLSELEAHRLTLERETADFFEATAAASGNPRAAANFALNDLPRAQGAAGHDARHIPIPAERLARLIRMIDAGTLSHAAARALFVELYAGGREPEDLVRERGLEQVSDAAPLESAVRSTLDRFPEQVSAYRSGKTQLLAFFVGHVMRATGGRGNPRTVQAILERMLG